MRRSARTLLAITLGATWLVPLVAPAGAPVGPVTGSDFDGDGYGDLAIGAPGAGGGGTVTVLYGTSDGLQDADGHQILTQNSPGVAGIAEDDDGFGSSLAHGDFDGDGYDDIAIGVPRETMGERQHEIPRVGAVNVLYGSRDGLTGERDRLFTQDTRGVKGRAESGDGFGAAVASGDFDGDGYADLAIAAPSEGIGNGWPDFDGEAPPGEFPRAGLVHVLRGSPRGLTARGDQLWHQDRPGVKGVVGACPFDGHSVTGEWFGAAVATGDLNGDGYTDLAIGVPNEPVEGCTDNQHLSGSLHVLLGSPEGVTAAGDQVWNQDVPGITERAEVGDRFAEALAIGDVNGDGRDDLAIGIPGEDEHGAIAVLYGSLHGATATLSEFVPFTDLDAPADGAESFGGALAVGDFDRDGIGDLATGAPHDAFGPADGLPGIAGWRGDKRGGSVTVFEGSATGLRTARARTWTQDSDGIAESGGDAEEFGRHLATGDFDGDGAVDLAIGVPFEQHQATEIDDQDPPAAGGAVHVLRGSDDGITTSGSVLWHQDSEGLDGGGRFGDRFGVL